jgi:opacity protein-like surface antigen
VALALFAAGVACAQSGAFYVRGAVNYQRYSDVALYDNLPPGPGSWFGYGQPGNPFGFVIPGNPDEGTRFPLDSRWGGGLAVGYRALPYLRGELAVDHAGNSTLRFPYPALIAPSPDQFGSFTVSNTQIMGNVYLDIAPLLPSGTLGPVNPYLMAGAGVSRNKNSNTTCTSLNSCTDFSYASSATNNSFAWQAGVGVVWQVTPALGLDIGYRYLDLGEIRGTDVFVPSPAWGLNGSLKAHRLTAGVIYSFGGK